jgi:hypothetical protein
MFFVVVYIFRKHRTYRTTAGADKEGPHSIENQCLPSQMELIQASRLAIHFQPHTHIQVTVYDAVQCRGCPYRDSCADDTGTAHTHDLISKFSTTIIIYKII